MESNQSNENENNQQLTTMQPNSYKRTMINVLNKTKNTVGWCFTCKSLFNIIFHININSIYFRRWPCYYSIT